MVKIIYLVIYILISCNVVYAEPISMTILGTTLTVTWGAMIAAAATIAATAIGVTGSILQGQQQKAVARYNQQINLQNAAAQRQAAQAQIANQRRQLMFTQGSQLAKLGGMGALAEGTPLDLLGQTAGQGKYDQLVTQYQGEVGAIQFQQKAALNKYEADVAGYNTVLNATTKVVEGAGKVGSLLGGGITLDSGQNLNKAVGDFSTSTGANISTSVEYDPVRGDKLLIS